MLGAELQMASELQGGSAMRCDDKRDALTAPLAALVGWSRRSNPALVVTCARGSSAHAATFAKHLFERHLGIPRMARRRSHMSPRSTGNGCNSRTNCCSPSRNRVEATISLSSPSMAKAAGAAQPRRSSTIRRARSRLLATSCCRWHRGGRSSASRRNEILRRQFGVLLRVIAEWKEDDALRARHRAFPGEAGARDRNQVG